MDITGQGSRKRRSVLRLIAYLAVPAIAATAGVRYYQGTSKAPDSQNIARLAGIVGEHRLARARLSGGFAYAPCQVDTSGTRLVRGLVCEGPEPTTWKSADRLRKFAASIRTSHADATAPVEHTFGVWELVWGNFDDAVADLREAVRRQPSNARALNDLAVALSESAQRHDDPALLIDAFVAADSAVRLDGSLREAQFTLAVLLEQLYLQTDAMDAWKRYLQLDSSSPWATESRGHLRALEPRANQWREDSTRLIRAVSGADTETIGAIVAEHPSETQQMILRLFGGWGAALEAGDTAQARAQLAVARALAEPLRAATSDALMRDAVAAIDRAFARNDTGRIRALAKGHLALANASKPTSNRAVAVAELATVRKLLEYGASPMSRWALWRRAAVQAVQLQEPDSALAAFRLLRDSTPAQYAVLRSNAAQYQGFVYDVQSDYLHLLSAYDSALVESRATNDPQIALRVGSWLAQAEAVLRGRRIAWRRQYAVLAATPRYPNSYNSLYTAFDYAAVATADEAPRLSFRYCEQVIRVARKLADPLSLSYALRRRAELLAKLGQPNLALRDVTAALDTARHIKDTTVRSKQIADVMLAGARISLLSAPAAAETALRQVVDEYKVKKYELDLSSAYLYLAQSRAAAGMIEPARSAFDSATSVMQRHRATVADYAQRGAFVDAARDVIDQIVAFHAGHSRRDAFEYFEATRSRVLLEELEQRRGRSADSSPSALAALQRRLAKEDIVFSYAVLPSELLIWVIGPDRFEQHRVPVPAPELERLVDQFRQSVLGGSTEPDITVSERLYRLLVDSAGTLDPNANLIVIPDRWLHFVPFAALHNPSTGHYLVRDHAVSFAPSATLLTSNLARIRQRFAHSSKVLAIGNPAFDKQEFQLQNLPAAEGEARRIASLYANGTVLTGRDATDAALEQLAPSFDVIHFAGHAVVGRDAPQLSHLVLARDGKSEGVVFSSEIARWTLPRTRLVILSGCSTADGKLSATEGATSLARAFFTAGVPEVVSSLWAIDDDETADFFVAFHRRLAEGVPASVALRETQIKWLGNGPTPTHPVRSWAAFQLFGG